MLRCVADVKRCSSVFDKACKINISPIKGPYFIRSNPSQFPFCFLISQSLIGEIKSRHHVKVRHKFIARVLSPGKKRLKNPLECSRRKEKNSQWRRRHKVSISISDELPQTDQSSRRNSVIFAHKSADRESSLRIKKQETRPVSQSLHDWGRQCVREKLQVVFYVKSLFFVLNFPSSHPFPTSPSFASRQTEKYFFSSEKTAAKKRRKKEKEN